MSTRQYLIDASTRHQVFLQRYGAGESKKAIKLLNRLRRDINARLAQEPTAFQRNRLAIVLQDIEQLSAVAFKDIAGKVKSGAGNLAVDEAEFSTKLFNKASSANFAMPAENVLIAAVEAAPMAAPAGMAGITIDESLRDYGKKKAAQITQTITDGLILGDTTPEISKKVGSMMNTLHRRQLDTLVRTAANHTSSVAREMTYQQNSDLLDGYQWVSTLDNRTTMICASRDGKTYAVDSGVMPPAHWGCRSTTIPVVMDEFTIAKPTKVRPAKGAAGAGTVSGKTTYGGWLKKQPKEFIDEALGVERSKLFRSGKLTIDKFVDPTGRVYTLDQLRSMNPFAFAEN